jgi:hypothetical protein
MILGSRDQLPLHMLIKFRIETVSLCALARDERINDEDCGAYC